ncbi:MAG: hypothetical protein ACUVXG_11510 [Anaerolineae bacterium]
MNKQQANEFRERWQAIADIEAEEQRMATLSLCWQQMNAILRLAMDLGLPPAQPSEKVEIVRQQWNRLKGLQA